MPYYIDGEDKIGVAINYYWDSGFSRSVKYSTLLSIQMVKENSHIGRIILIDGSPILDNEMMKLCQSLGIYYYHHGTELGFAAGFNVGWHLLEEPYICLMANDVFPPKETMEKLFDYIKMPDIGCVFPYLSYSDYPGQIYTNVRKPITCEPTTMTLNLNVFKRKVLEQVRGVDETYSGSYNDLILLMKIREMGYRVLLVGNTRVFHLGQMTISQGTTYQKGKDRTKFIEQYGKYVAANGMWQVTHWKWPLMTTYLVGFMWWITQKFPSTTVRRWLQMVAVWIGPEISRYPARFGKNKD